MATQGWDVGILGATGMVGQQLVRRLEGHPWFRLTWVAASERSEGRRYGDTPWLLGGSVPDGARDLRVEKPVPGRAPQVLFSALDAEFEVEHYLQHQGEAFVDRFDANSLLCVTRAIDYFDLVPAGGTLADAFSRTDAEFLFLTFSSDWLYPPRHLEAAADAARSAGRPVAYREIPSDYGHDAFLLEHQAQEPVIRGFLGDGDRYNPWRHSGPETSLPCPPRHAAARTGSPSASWPSSAP